MIKSRASLAIDCHTCAVSHLCIAHELLPEEIDQLNQTIVTIRSFQKKDPVCHAQTPLQNLYAVRSGSCKEYWIDANGNECVTNFYLPGDIIGIESTAGQTHLFSVTALEETELCVIPMLEFLQLMQDSPNILKRFLNITSLKLQNEQSVKINVTAKERVCDFLLNIIVRSQQRNAHQKEIYLPMSQVDISNYLGIAYETVNRVFKNLKRKKIIKMKNKTLEVLDIIALENASRFDYPVLT